MVKGTIKPIPNTSKKAEIIIKENKIIAFFLFFFDSIFQILFKKFIFSNRACSALCYNLAALKNFYKAFYAGKKLMSQFLFNLISLFPKRILRYFFSLPKISKTIFAKGPLKNLPLLK